MQPVLTPHGAMLATEPFRRAWSTPSIKPGAAAAHLALCSWGSPDPHHRNPESLGFERVRLRGRPPEEKERAAGQPSGGPCKRDYLSKFTKREGRVRIDLHAPPEYALSRASWQTMKYDQNWHAYNDFPRPYAPSDLTGFAKLYLGNSYVFQDEMSTLTMCAGVVARGYSLALPEEDATPGGKDAAMKRWKSAQQNFYADVRALERDLFSIQACILGRLREIAEEQSREGKEPAPLDASTPTLASQGQNMPEQAVLAADESVLGFVKAVEQHPDYQQQVCHVKHYPTRPAKFARFDSLVDEKGSPLLSPEALTPRHLEKPVLCLAFRRPCLDGRRLVRPVVVTLMVEARPSNLCRQLFGFVVAWVTVSGSPNGTRDPRSQDVALEVLRDIERSTWQLSKDGKAFSTWNFLPKDPDLGRGLSPRPWFQEVVDRYGAPPRQHPQRYKLHDGRRLSVLMENNTVPIRFHLNFDTLYEEKVQANPYTKDRYCFQEGAWFRIGYPDEKPSGSGPDDCGDRTTTYVTGNKWCICTSNDLISDQMRDFEVMKQVPKFFRVNPVEEQLQFRNFEGSYPAMWETTGRTGVCCDPDCQKGLHVVVPDSFCTEGVAADAVLSLSMPPPIPGVGGAGTFCSADQHGRPTHMVFQWHRRITPAQFAQSSTQEPRPKGIARGRRAATGSFRLRDTRSWFNSGEDLCFTRRFTALALVEDEDGSRDFIYHFVKGTRVYEVAKAYFACEEDITASLFWPTQVLPS
eukprot:g23084.t1